MLEQELNCGICQQMYSSEPHLVPRVLPECGDTFCTGCLDEMLQSSTGAFKCPECQTENDRKQSASQYPKNFSLIRMADKARKQMAQSAVTPPPQQQQFMPRNTMLNETITDDTKSLAMSYDSRASTFSEKVDPALWCSVHNRKCEIICIGCQVRICTNCALFGAHKGHDIRESEELSRELEQRTDHLISLNNHMEMAAKNKIDQRQVESLNKAFQEKSMQMKLQLRQKFNEMRTILKIQENTCETILKKNLQHIEIGIAQMRKVPPQLFHETDNWISEAQRKLDLFQQNAHDDLFINFDMLESPQNDILRTGENLKIELDKHKDVSFPLVESQMKSLALNFSEDVQELIEHFCECTKVQGVHIDDSEIQAQSEAIQEVCREKQQKEDALDIKRIQELQRQNSGDFDFKQESSMVGPLSNETHSKLFGDDENDLLAEPLLSDRNKGSNSSRKTGFSQQDQISKSQAVAAKNAAMTQQQQRTGGSLMNTPSAISSNQQNSSSVTGFDNQAQVNVPRLNTELAQNNHGLEFEQQEVQPQELDQNNQNQEQPDQQVDMDLVEQIANYMQQSIEAEEKIVDLSDNYIADPGIEVVSAALPCCSVLESLSVKNTGMTDAGCKNLLIALKETPSMILIDLSQNPITDDVIQNAFDLLRVNPNLVQIDLKGMRITKKDTPILAKEFGDRIVM